jgi:predicted nucleic acid-binding Zn ribbon protein
MATNEMRDRGIEQPPWLRELLRAQGRVPSNPPAQARSALGEPVDRTAELDVPRSDLVECPRCGTLNYDIAATCKNCQWKFVRECRVCGHLVPPGATRCEHCGAATSRHASFGPAMGQPVSGVAPAESPAPTEATTGKAPSAQVKEALRLRNKRRRRGATAATTALAVVTIMLVLLIWPPAGAAIASVIHVNPHDWLTQLATWLNQRFSR